MTSGVHDALVTIDRAPSRAALPRNARALMRAKQLGGEIKYLSPGEIAARNRGYSPYSVETWRTWEYWANKCGCGHLLTRPDEPPKS